MASSAAADKRLERLQNLSQNQTVIRSSGASYIRYALEGPRPYNLISLFTAKAKRCVCNGDPAFWPRNAWLSL